MKKYAIPEMEIVVFSAEDVIATSGIIAVPEQGGGEPQPGDE